MESASRDVLALAVLSEPQRARIYAYLVSANGPRTRQDVSEALRIGRTLAAFHLDRLEHAGLIRLVGAGPVTGRPGRPARRYQVAQPEVSASVPPRRYELLAEILVQAAGEQGANEPFVAAALRVASRRGRQLAAGYRDVRQEGAAPEPLSDLLTWLGYQPSEQGREVLLTNCPFQRLRELDTKLVCSINVALAAGYLQELGVDDNVSAHLRPSPTNCCVVLSRSA